MRSAKGGVGSRSDTVGLARDPGIGVMVGFALVCGTVFLLGVGDDAFKIRFVWVAQVPLDAALCWFAWRASRVPGLERVSSRFMRTIAFAALMFTIGDTTQLIRTVWRPTVADINGGPVQSVFFLIGVTALVIRMLRHPMPSGSSGERLRYHLDAVTVLVGSAVLAWCLSVNPAGNAGVQWYGALAAISVSLVAAFAATKLVLGGNAPMTRAASTPMIAAAILGAGLVVTPAEPDLVLRPELLALRVLPSLLIALGPRIQELQARHNPVSARRRQARPYNMLPYLAVAVTFVVFLLVMPRNIGLRAWGIVAGVVLITAIVVVRQLLAFIDNFELIKRLDATLLELRGHQKLLHEQATHDNLTGLANRSAFADAVTAALAELAESTGPAGSTAVLLIDLDDFKTVNDTLGHAVGDALLVAVADRLRCAVREDDLVARLGGDEFAILLRSVTEAQANATAERILAEVVQPVQVGDHTLAARGSIGVAPATPGDDLERLMRNADIAMYAAKDAGKGGFQRYAPDMGARLMETAELGARLRDAIGSDQFHLVYQPVVDLVTGAVVGAEALVRWRPPGCDTVMPAEFIGTAESTGLIVPLGRWILREACRQLAEWRRPGPDAHGLLIGINVAGRQLQEQGFVDDVAAALAASGLPADRLVLEFTETAVLDNAGATGTLAALHRLGVGLAIDDFGTAASSLGLLLTCPVGVLKLDRSFVDGLDTDPRQRAVATAVIQMAGALGLDAVAEGVETPEQAEILRDLGYGRAQGFLYSRPLRADDFAARVLAAPVPAPV